jgi:hypothetical protein
LSIVWILSFWREDVMFKAVCYRLVVVLFLTSMGLSSAEEKGAVSAPADASKTGTTAAKDGATASLTKTEQ